MINLHEPHTFLFCQDCIKSGDQFRYAGLLKVFTFIPNSAWNHTPWNNPYYNLSNIRAHPWRGGCEKNVADLMKACKDQFRKN